MGKSFLLYTNTATLFPGSLFFEFFQGTGKEKDPRRLVWSWTDQSGKEWKWFSPIWRNRVRTIAASSSSRQGKKESKIKPAYLTASFLVQFLKATKIWPKANKVYFLLLVKCLLKSKHFLWGYCALRFKPLTLLTLFLSYLLEKCIPQPLKSLRLKLSPRLIISNI